MGNEKKSGKIGLHHFGESLVSEIINKMTTAKFLEFLWLEGFCPICDPEKSLHEKNSILESIAGICENESARADTLVGMTPIRINKYKEFRIDTEHDIDVALISDLSDLCFPIEVKMGFRGPIKTWDSFLKDMIKRAVKIRYGHKNDPHDYLDGAMASFLAKLLKSDDLSSVESVIQKPEFARWGLCIRKENIKSFQEPSDSSSNKMVVPIIFTFEDLLLFYKSQTNNKWEDIVDSILEKSKSPLKSEIATVLNQNCKKL